MSTNVKVREVVTYGGHSISANGSVNFTLKAAYSELVNTIKVMQMLNNDITIKAKLPGSKAMQLGSFRVKQITIDGDGESVLKFNSLDDYVELDALNTLPTGARQDKPEFAVLLEAEIEDEEETEGGEEDVSS